MANRGLKRMCASCGIKFYDMEKQPIKCPSCGAEFTGDVEVKSRRSRSTIAADTVNRDEIEEKNKDVASVEDDETISLDDLDEGDDTDSDDDLSDLGGDVEISVDSDDN